MGSGGRIAAGTARNSCRDGGSNGPRARTGRWRGLDQCERIDHRTLEAQRVEAIERGQGARAEKLDRDPEIHLGKAAWMARRRGDGNARTRRNDRICAGNRAREMERSRLARVIRSLDAEIRAVRIREAVARGSAWASGKVKAGAALVRSIPQRRQEAKAARVQRTAERVSGRRWRPGRSTHGPPITLVPHLCIERRRRAATTS